MVINKSSSRIPIHSRNEHLACARAHRPIRQGIFARRRTRWAFKRPEPRICLKMTITRQVLYCVCRSSGFARRTDSFAQTATNSDWRKRR